MKDGKSNFIYKMWQILKRFAGTFCRAQTQKLGGVYYQMLMLGCEEF